MRFITWGTTHYIDQTAICWVLYITLGVILYYMGHTSLYGVNHSTWARLHYIGFFKL